MPGAMRDWILPPREGGPNRLSCWTVYTACHGEAASPGAGRAVYPTLLEVHRPYATSTSEHRNRGQRTVVHVITLLPVHGLTQAPITLHS